MRFGVVLPTYPVGATVGGVVRVAQVAESLGFASIWTTDHVIMQPEEAGPYDEIFEGLTTLAYLAGLTRTIKLGISVLVVPQRNGILLAKELATLDRFASGRLLVGVGSGWNEAEFRMLDASERFRHRGAYLDETIDTWRHLWTHPEQPFKGTFFDLPPVAFGPLPADGQNLPIWVGGSSPAAIRRAGRAGAAWHPVGSSPEELRSRVPALLAAAGEVGRRLPEIAPRLSIELEGTTFDPKLKGRMTSIVGSDVEIAQQLRAYQDIGVAEIVCLFGTPDGEAVVERMARFASAIMPDIER